MFCPYYLLAATLGSRIVASPDVVGGEGDAVSDTFAILGLGLEATSVGGGAV